MYSHKTYYERDRIMANDSTDANHSSVNGIISTLNLQYDKNDIRDKTLVPDIIYTEFCEYVHNLNVVS